MLVVFFIDIFENRIIYLFDFFLYIYCDDFASVFKKNIVGINNTKTKNIFLINFMQFSLLEEQCRCF